MRNIPLAVSLALAPIPAIAGDWTVLRNERFGFSVDVPAAYKAAPPPENNDGRAYTSADGQIKISAYGHLFVEVKTLAEDAAQEEGFARTDGLVVTYRNISQQTFTLSGLKGDRILFEHGVPTCNATAAAIIVLDYPAAQKARLDPVVARMVRSLHGSNGCWSPG